jgi:probable F420-dependent oxidoreductase
MKIGVNTRVASQSMDIAVVAQKAESLGFESLWLPEHGVMPVHVATRYQGSSDGSIPPSMSDIGDPFIGLARASAVTKTLKLGTGICLVPEHNPLLLAKEIATLDHLSNGRFLFGIGAGWLREETEIMGGDFEHRWSQTREAILIMKELWTKAEAEFHGKFYDFPLVRSSPKPFQKPHPPIFLGGSAGNVFKRIVAWGDGWMPIRATPQDIKSSRATLDELADAAGRDPRSIEIMVYGEASRSRKVMPP